jgi:hypothetical protein
MECMLSCQTCSSGRRKQAWYNLAVKSEMKMLRKDAGSCGHPLPLYKGINLPPRHDVGSCACAMTLLVRQAICIANMGPPALMRSGGMSFGPHALPRRNFRMACIICQGEMKALGSSSKSALERPGRHKANNEDQVIGSPASVSANCLSQTCCCC